MSNQHEDRDVMKCKHFMKSKQKNKIYVEYDETLILNYDVTLNKSRLNEILDK